jgi:hypothetical protein
MQMIGAGDLCSPLTFQQSAQSNRAENLNGGPFRSGLDPSPSYRRRASSTCMKIQQLFAKKLEDACALVFWSLWPMKEVSDTQTDDS